MRGHPRTDGLFRLRAGTAWVWLLFGLATIAAAQQDEDGAQGPGVAADPIDLAAHRVRHWTAGGDQWVILEGQAAVLQGAEGIRADRAVVRAIPRPKEGAQAYAVEVYAEVSTPSPRSGGRPGTRPLRASFRTREGVALKPYSAAGLARLAGPPLGEPLLQRACGLPPGSGIRRPAPAQARERPKAIEPPRPVVARAAPVTARGTRPSPPPRTTRTEFRPRIDPTALAVVAPPPTTAPPAKDPAPPAESPKSDPAVRKAQFPGDRGPGELLETEPTPAPRSEPGPAAPEAIPSVPEAGGTAPSVTPEPAPSVTPGPGLDAGGVLDLEPLPEPSGSPPPSTTPNYAVTAPPPIAPGTRRVISIYPRDSTNFEVRELPKASKDDPTRTVVIKGGVIIIAHTGSKMSDADRKKMEAERIAALKKVQEARQRGLPPPPVPPPPPSENDKMGTVDISADNVVIWLRDKPEPGAARPGANGSIDQDARQPFEVYMEGNVILRQDERRYAGNGDQRTFLAKSAYYDFRTERFIGLDGELSMFAPTLVTPVRVMSLEINQFRLPVVKPDGQPGLGLKQIRAEKTVTTGSRFANPGYKFNSRSVDIFQKAVPLADPQRGRVVGDANAPAPAEDLHWIIDARQNAFFLGPVPAFYWPRFYADADEIDPPIRNIMPGFINYFGQFVLTDWNGFKLLNTVLPDRWKVTKPRWIDIWNIDIDELAKRGVAFGSEIGWFGNANSFPGSPGDFTGYLDIWGLRDYGLDVLGSGPAVITNGPLRARKAGYQRSLLPPFQNFRGKLTFRHMQRLIPDNEGTDDFRAQVEVGYLSDRHFLEQYYKRLFDTGLDQETLGYVQKQTNNTAWSVLTEANLQNWYTETQWLPRLDYYRLGDSLLGNWLSYYHHSGADWANTHTAVEVNNPTIFAFMPYDPVSNTSGPLRTGRIYTAHELDAPINLNVLRIIPYVQGQFVGWNNQLGGQQIGRVWGAAGARADIMAWKMYPNVESELFNVHGLNHKINLTADARDAYSNVPLNAIGVQDDLDDNTYEFVRRYFALTNYAGGILPMQYDPRFLILRRAISPITGTTDIQASMETVQLALHQRLQTRRGPVGKRRVIDWMNLDLSTTYFPYAARDNFGVPFGQNMYNYEWYLGDRTAIQSFGWFEFFNIVGTALNKTNPTHTNDPFLFKVVTAGVAIARPPRANVFFGYTIINTGPIATSALNINYSYWMSPKWFSAFNTMYDFGNAVWLGSMLSMTRVGADYLTTIGITVDPQRNATQVGLQIMPRVSPSVSRGQAQGLQNFDSRYAPTQ